jgi:nucleotide-binding universal stress UspA family protein
MAYRNILVHIDDTKASAGCVQAALALAQAHDAHLTGLYVIVEPGLPAFIAAEVPGDVLAQHRENARKAAEQAAERFRGELDRAGLKGECRIDGGLIENVAPIVALHARYADLVVVGQYPVDEEPATDRFMVENLALSSGRPALVIPYIGAPKGFGRTVTVTWDTGREAARAVADAMPLLERAERVHVLSVNPRSGISGHGEEPGADIALHLARHGIETEVNHTHAEDVGVGDVILSWLSDSGSDLLVMGAYGHSRLRELILGGVTRRILESMTVPVLLSH